MIALVRPVSDSFDRALTRKPGPRPDIAGARAEHARYVATLRDLLDEVVVIPPAHDQPDACFVEDMAVVVGDRVVLGRSGAISRRAEQNAVIDDLPASLSRHVLPEGALLDGGDVLHVDDRLFVGVSARTNPAAVHALHDLLAPDGITVVPIQVRDALHLKCHCTSPGPGRVLLAEGFADPELFGPLDVIPVPPSEAYAANVVGIGQHVLVAEGYPYVNETLNRLGFDPIPQPVVEIAKADGSLTCLSILVA